MASFTDVFIRRPVLATVVSLLILLVGVQAGLDSRSGNIPNCSRRRS